MNTEVFVAKLNCTLCTHKCSSAYVKEAGCSLIVNEIDRTFHGTIAYGSADNLGAQALGGFKESCSARKPCRYCLGTNEEIRSKVHKLK